MTIRNITKQLTQPGQPDLLDYIVAAYHLVNGKQGKPKICVYKVFFMFNAVGDVFVSLLLAGGWSSVTKYT